MSDPFTLGLGLAGIGTTLLQSYLTKKALERGNTEDSPRRGMIDKLRQTAGIEDIRVNHHSIPALGTNTMYATIKPNASPAERAGLGVGVEDNDVILFHPKAGREIIAHELGHAQMNRGVDANRATQLNQKLAGNFGYQRLAALPIASTAAAAIADDPLQAAAMGVGASLLMDSPQLVNEFQANRRALKLLDESGLRKRGSFGRIAGLYATYPMNSVAKGLVGAALGYGGQQFFGGDEAA